MCCTVARLGCSLHAHVCFTYCVSISSIVPKYLMQTAALLHLNSLLNPFLVPPVWPLLHFLPARPHKYYPCTTNSIMRAVKRGKPTALSVFITLGTGQDANGKKFEDFCFFSWGAAGTTATLAEEKRIMTWTSDMMSVSTPSRENYYRCTNMWIIRTLILCQD